MKSLETLNINMCSKLERLPARLGCMESLTELLGNETAIKQLPSSIGHLKKLRKLSLGACDDKQDLLSPSCLSIAIPSVLIDPYNWMKNDPIMGFFFSINGKFKMLGDGNGGFIVAFTKKINLLSAPSSFLFWFNLTEKIRSL
jgi:hypothetical protein